MEYFKGFNMKEIKDLVNITHGWVTGTTDPPKRGDPVDKSMPGPHWDVMPRPGKRMKAPDCGHHSIGPERTPDQVGSITFGPVDQKGETRSASDDNTQEGKGYRLGVLHAVRTIEEALDTGTKALSYTMVRGWIEALRAQV